MSWWLVLVGFLWASVVRAQAPPTEAALMQWGEALEYTRSSSPEARVDCSPEAVRYYVTLLFSSPGTRRTVLQNARTAWRAELVRRQTAVQERTSAQVSGLTDQVDALDALSAP